MDTSKSVHAIALAAMVLVVALSAAIASRLPMQSVVAATALSQRTTERAAREQERSAAWKDELATDRAQLKQAQVKQAHQREAATAAAATPAAPPAPAPAPAPAPPPAPLSVPQIIQAAFAPLGATAVQWGYCTALHESTDNPSAIQIGGGGAEGLFQFIPSTWVTTPQGAAGDSIFDATSSAEAAAWMYSQGQQGQWSTNADFCSMYD